MNGDLQEEIYIEQPDGYRHPKYPSYVCKLKKAWYDVENQTQLPQWNGFHNSSGHTG